MIAFRLDDNEFKLAEQNAISSGVTSINAFAKRRVLEIDAKPLNIPVNKVPSKAIKTCLYPHEIELVKRNAALHGMSLSREIAIRVRQSLLKSEVCLYPDEVKVLNTLSTAVDRVGRNIHFIIKGERFCTVNDPSFRKDVLEVIELCKNIDSTLESLTRSVVNRFG
uniref:Uncharacterized protein n=2 Tax=Yersinia pestis TaxID=632 RepID=E8PS61_YERPE|nr:conserved hypothetical protein [Yersinia pestis Java 9]